MQLYTWLFPIWRQAHKAEGDHSSCPVFVVFGQECLRAFLEQQGVDYFKNLAEDIAGAQGVALGEEDPMLTLEDIMKTHLIASKGRYVPLQRGNSALLICAPEVKMKAWFGLNSSVRELIRAWPVLLAGTTAILALNGEDASRNRLKPLSVLALQALRLKPSKVSLQNHRSFSCGSLLRTLRAPKGPSKTI